MYLDNFKNEKEDITRVPTASADRLNIDRRGSRGDSLNKPAQLERIKMTALESMRKLEAAPGKIKVSRQVALIAPTCSVAQVYVQCTLYIVKMQLYTVGMAVCDLFDTLLQCSVMVEISERNAARCM